MPRPDSCYFQEQREGASNSGWEFRLEELDKTKTEMRESRCVQETESGSVNWRTVYRSGWQKMILEG